MEKNKIKLGVKMKNFKQVLEEIENNKNKLKKLNTIDEKEIERGYNLFYDQMIKIYGYCDMSYYDFKKNIYYIIDNNKKKPPEK